MGSERILYEDEDFLVFNKIPGELVQRDRGGAPSLAEVLSPRSDSGFFAPVHRLDRPASGLVLFAKTRRFFNALATLFRERQMAKVYWAVVERAPLPPAAVLAHRLVPDRRKNKVFVREDAASPNALLSYRLIGASDRYFFLVIDLITGKQHQIRAQLAAAGCPVKGDVKYGARRANPDRSVLLHARELSFAHPLTHSPFSLTAPPPSGALWELFTRTAEAGGGAT